MACQGEPHCYFQQDLQCPSMLNLSCPSSPPVPSRTSGVSELCPKQSGWQQGSGEEAIQSRGQ